MTGELIDDGENAYISEFVSYGTKNYDYKVVVPTNQKHHDTVKISGVTLSITTSKRLNVYLLLRLVKAFVKNGFKEVNIVSLRIERKKASHQVVTKSVCKSLRLYTIHVLKK